VSSSLPETSLIYTFVRCVLKDERHISLLFLHRTSRCGIKPSITHLHAILFPFDTRYILFPQLHYFTLQLPSQPQHILSPKCPLKGNSLLPLLIIPHRLHIPLPYNTLTNPTKHQISTPLPTNKRQHPHKAHQREYSTSPKRSVEYTEVSGPGSELRASTVGIADEEEWSRDGGCVG